MPVKLFRVCDLTLSTEALKQLQSFYQTTALHIIIIIIIRQPCVLWLGEGLSMSSPNYPVLCCPLPYHVAPVFVQVVSPPLGWSPLTSFLVIWSPSGVARGPSVVFEAVDMPCPGPFHCSHSVDYIYEFCPLPNPDAPHNLPFMSLCPDKHSVTKLRSSQRTFLPVMFHLSPS